MFEVGGANGEPNQVSLGYNENGVPWTIGWGGTMTIPEHRVKALASYSRPVTKKGLRSFLGAISFYRRHVDLLAKNTAVLSPSTAKLAPSKVIWSGEIKSAFISICNLSVNHTPPRRCSECSYRCFWTGDWRCSPGEKRWRMGSSCILQPADSWGEAVVLCHRTSNVGSS